MVAPMIFLLATAVVTAAMSPYQHQQLPANLTVVTRGCDRRLHFMRNSFRTFEPGVDFVAVEIGAAESQTTAELHCGELDVGHGVFYVWHRHALEYDVAKSQLNTVFCHVLQRWFPLEAFYKYSEADLSGVVGGVCLPEMHTGTTGGVTETSVTDAPTSGASATTTTTTTTATTPTTATKTSSGLGSGSAGGNKQHARPPNLEPEATEGPAATVATAIVTAATTTTTGEPDAVTASVIADGSGGGGEFPLLGHQGDVASTTETDIPSANVGGTTPVSSTSKLAVQATSPPMVNMQGGAPTDHPRGAAAAAAPTSAGHSSGGLAIGATAGMAVGALLVVMAVLGAVVIRRRQRLGQSNATEDPEHATPVEPIGPGGACPTPTTDPPVGSTSDDAHRLAAGCEELYDTIDTWGTMGENVYGTATDSPVGLYGAATATDYGADVVYDNASVDNAAPLPQQLHLPAYDVVTPGAKTYDIANVPGVISGDSQWGEPVYTLDSATASTTAAPLNSDYQLATAMGPSNDQSELIYFTADAMPAAANVMTDI